MSLRSLLLLAIAALPFSATSAADTVTAEEKRPNFLFILTDDQASCTPYPSRHGRWPRSRWG